MDCNGAPIAGASEASGAEKANDERLGKTGASSEGNACETETKFQSLADGGETETESRAKESECEAGGVVVKPAADESPVSCNDVQGEEAGGSAIGHSVGAPVAKAVAASDGHDATIKPRAEARGRVLLASSCSSWSSSLLVAPAEARAGESGPAPSSGQQQVNSSEGSSSSSVAANDRDSDHRRHSELSSTATANSLTRRRQQNSNSQARASASESPLESNGNRNNSSDPSMAAARIQIPHQSSVLALASADTQAKLGLGSKVAPKAEAQAIGCESEASRLARQVSNPDPTSDPNAVVSVASDGTRAKAQEKQQQQPAATAQADGITLAAHKISVPFGQASCVWNAIAAAAAAAKASTGSSPLSAHTEQPSASYQQSDNTKKTAIQRPPTDTLLSVSSSSANTTPTTTNTTTTSANNSDHEHHHHHLITDTCNSNHQHHEPQPEPTKKPIESQAATNNDTDNMNDNNMKEPVPAGPQPVESNSPQVTNNTTVPINNRTVLILREIDSKASESSVKNIFDSENCPSKPVHCEYALHNSWYVTFKDYEDAKLALAYIRKYIVKWNDRPIMARFKPKPAVPSATDQPTASGVPPLVMQHSSQLDATTSDQVIATGTDAGSPSSSSAKSGASNREPTTVVSSSSESTSETNDLATGQPVVSHSVSAFSQHQQQNHQMMHVGPIYGPPQTPSGYHPQAHHHAHHHSRHPHHHHNHSHHHHQPGGHADPAPHQHHYGYSAVAYYGQNGPIMTQWHYPNAPQYDLSEVFIYNGLSPYPAPMGGKLSNGAPPTQAKGSILSVAGVSSASVLGGEQTPPYNPHAHNHNHHHHYQPHHGLVPHHSHHHHNQSNGQGHHQHAGHHYQHGNNHNRDTNRLNGNQQTYGSPANGFGSGKFTGHQRGKNNGPGFEHSNKSSNAKHN